MCCQLDSACPAAGAHTPLPASHHEPPCVMLPVHRRSLEELRVPACKPYVSPEALARASLEAIQQNPHPLGQQLPNPVAAAAQQHAAMAAMGGPRQGGGGGGMRGGRGMQHHQPPDSGNSSLAPSAAPFVPGGFHPSGALGAVEMQCLCWRGEAASLVAASRPLPPACSGRRRKLLQGARQRCLAVRQGANRLGDSLPASELGCM